ncbi:membrane-associated phospholipid phosphatase [Thermobifida halotolerans]|uniref:phosphatase PAP2 family protein n=1 Tax=Thermobifida halotolerans TaxID=483545 RepID=UPI000EE338D8|nr:phosphatase PAP2 family protein [Thermobifida halotolerans]
MTDTAPSRVLLRRTATVVSEVFAPVVLVVTVLPVVGWSSTHSLAGVGWGLFAVLFCAVVPYAVVLVGVRRGHWSDHHIRDRSQRTVPFLIAIGCVAAGTAALAVLDAPRAVLALVVAMLAGLVSTTVVTRWWKISVHTAVAAGVASVLTLVYGPMLAVTFPLVACVGWSRVELDCHTTAQTVAGALLGTVVCVLFFTLLR